MEINLPEESFLGQKISNLATNSILLGPALACGDRRIQLGEEAAGGLRRPPQISRIIMILVTKIPQLDGSIAVEQRDDSLQRILAFMAIFIKLIRRQS